MLEFFEIGKKLRIGLWGDGKGEVFVVEWCWVWWVGKVGVVGWIMVIG